MLDRMDSPALETCQSCEVLSINGLRCHETGCPDAWHDETRECAECGSEFEPQHRADRCCDDECRSVYHGL